jgi:predicted nucleic acid-binding protein
MNIIIDTNIIIDVIAVRKPFYENALEIWHNFGKKKIACAITASTASDIYYIARKYIKDNEKTLSMLKKLFKIFDIITVTKEDCLKAFETGIKDYEDSLLSVCASKWNADFIVTRNSADFSNSIVSAISPEEFLAKLKLC